MSHFWLHLRLLLWKNIILKLRQPVFLALEIIWPVFLFGGILVPLRLQFPSESTPDSRYRANALPSAGLFPFMQSVVCDLSKGPSNYSSDMPYYPNASVNDIYNLLDGVSSWNGSWNRVCTVLRETAAIRPCANTSEEALLRLLNSPTSLDIVDLQQLLSCGVLDQIRELNDVLALTESVSLYFRFANSTGSLSYEGLEKFLCGDLPVDDSVLKSILRRLMQGDRTQRAFKQQSANDDGNGNGTGDGKQSSDRVAPKVLFTASRENMHRALSIMRRANRTIQSVEFFKSLAEQTHNCSEFFLETFPPNSPQVKILNEVIDILLNSSNGVFPPLSNLLPSNASLLLAKQLLDPNNPNSIWKHVSLSSNISLSILDQIAAVDWEIFTPVTSEAEMQDLSSNYLLQQQKGISVVFAGIVLEDFLTSQEGELQSVKLRIRMNSTYVHDTTLLRETVWVPGPEDQRWKRRYLDAGFVLLQDMVERGAMEEILGHALLSPASYLNQMPYPCYEDDLFAQAMIVMLPISMTLAWLFSVAMTVRAIVLEKELRLREVMRMMGLSDGILRLSWFITSLVVFTISVTVISAVLKLSGIMPYTNGFILWLFLMVYAVAMISYCFFIATFFTSANLGACISALVYFVLFFGQVIVVTKQMYLNTAAIVLLSFVAPIGFGIGSNYMIDYEMQQVGLQWSNVLVPPLQETNFNFLGVVGVLLLDSLLYLIVAWYLEAVFPGKYGVAKPFYFMFQPSYWGVKSPSRVHDFELLSVDVEEDPLEDSSSTDTAGLPLGISVQHLSKVYTTGCFKWRKRIDAVKDLSVDFYEGQITALLGHNGAGKTTTMSLLTGLFGPTSGTARIYGNDIRHKMDHIRHSLGVCPQHNVLFDNLTVHEHMLFYGQLKGMSRKETLQQIPIWLEKVNLLSHSKKRSKHLSGGMQRKLSIMLAFLGDSRTVILDEPTSGVDPHARRQIWDFVGSHREGHTIILSTHHMDEAEILGDRIAVIANGSLRCCGSFEYLRKRFGQGHRLTLVSCPVQNALNRVTSVHLPDSQESNLITSWSSDQSPNRTLILHTSDTTVEHSDQSSCLPGAMGIERITDFIKEFIPSASLAEVRGLELHYLLPLNQSAPKVLARLFDHLTMQQTSLAVSSFGFTACSLDEIFLQLADDAIEDQNGNNSVREPHSSAPMASSEPHPSDKPMASSEPHPSDKPMAFSEPHPSAEPMASCEPHPSDEPMTSCEPHPSDEPMASCEPHPSDKPMGSSEPHPSDEPMASSEPHPSDEPMASSEPHPSDEPMASSEPHPTDGVGPSEMLLERSEDGPGGEDEPGDEDGTEEDRLWPQGETPLIKSYLKGPALWRAQYTSLLVKRLHYFRHKYIAIMVQTVFPLAIIAMSMMVARSLLDVTDQPSLELSPAVFFGASRDNYAFLAGPLTNATAPYLHTAYLPCGMDTSVMMSSDDQYSVCSRQGQEDKCVGYPDLHYTCMCLNCSERIPMTTPPACYNGTHTGTRLQDVTRVGGDSEGAYDFLTSYLQWTENDFIEVRYGGLSFGHRRDDIPVSLDQYYSSPSNTSLPFFAAHTAAKAWYSLKGYHAMPSYLNSLNNIILRTHLPPKKDPTIYGIKTYSHPFPFTNLQRLDYAVTELGSAIVNPLAAMFAIGFLAAGFVLLIIEEKSNKVKHLQLVCGLNRGIYWLSSATWDLCSYVLFMMAALLIYVAFQDPNLTSSVGLPSFFIILVSYGVAIVPWIYSLSFLFSSPSTAYIVLFCLNFFSGFALLIVDVVIAFLTEAAETSYALVYLPFPSYCLGRGMLYLTLDRVFQELVATFTLKPVPSPLVGMWPFIVSLWVQAIVYTVFVVMLESSQVWMCPLRRSQSVPKALPLSTSDDLVAKERERVLSNSSHEEILTLQNLTKEYGLQCSKNRHLAVNQLCLGMQKGECFGLLGVNGAGKTTTFKMLTGDTRPSYGDALVASHSISTGMGQVRQKIGYCPQVDALLDPLTGRQHLVHVCHLRGVPATQLNEAVSWALKKLGLEIIADKPAGTYSGGNRRRLSTAIALLGKPPLLLLDEPTSGVDPKARRFLWDIIRGVVAEGQSVLVTTHSMAECEALCGRVGIMVNGSFRCLGTPQQLKTRYGEGYRVKIRVNGQVEPVIEFLMQNLKNSVLKEQHSNILIYQLSLEGLKLSDIFNVMEIAREKLDIEDYSVTQTTLDDVFVFFASQQHDRDTLTAGQLDTRLSDHSTGTDGVYYCAEKDDVHC